MRNLKKKLFLFFYVWGLRAQAIPTCMNISEPNYRTLLSVTGDLRAVVPFRRRSWRRSQKNKSIHVANTFLSILSNDLFFHDSRDRLRPKRGTSRQNHLPELSRLNCLKNQSVCSKSSARLFFHNFFFKWLKSKIYEVTDVNGWGLPNRQFA